MSLADVEAHQRKHFGKSANLAPEPTKETAKVTKPRQNATEREYGLILEAMKRRLDINDYRPFGIRLEWGADPKTGKPMVYSPDFIVWPKLHRIGDIQNLTLIETKGGYIRPQDLIRFKGCRAEWPMFRFELHQKANGEWRQVY